LGPQTATTSPVSGRHKQTSRGNLKKTLNQIGTPYDPQENIILITIIIDFSDRQKHPTIPSKYGWLVLRISHKF
jgi:hypothetical protein